MTKDELVSSHKFQEKYRLQPLNSGTVRALNSHEPVAAMLVGFFHVALALPQIVLNFCAFYIVYGKLPDNAFVAAAFVFVPLIITWFLARLIRKWYQHMVAYRATSNFIALAALTDREFAVSWLEASDRVNHAYMLRCANDLEFLADEVQRSYLEEALKNGNGNSKDNIRDAEYEEISKYDAWLDNHPDEVAAHAGKFVAIHLEKGIIVSHDTMDAVIQEVRDRNLEDEVLLHVIESQEDEETVQEAG